MLPTSFPHHFHIISTSFPHVSSPRSVWRVRRSLAAPWPSNPWWCGHWRRPPGVGSQEICLSSLSKDLCIYSVYTNMIIIIIECMIVIWYHWIYIYTYTFLLYIYIYTYYFYMCLILIDKILRTFFFMLFPRYGSEKCVEQCVSDGFPHIIVWGSCL